MSDGILFDWDVTRRLCQDNQTMSGKYGAFCSYIYINLKSIKNETKLVDFLNSYCEYAMNISNEFDAGFGSLVECIRHVHSNVIRDSYAKKINRSEYNKIFHPVLKLPPSGNCSSNWMWNLQNDEFSYFSQSGQDGVLQTILLNIGMANRYYVEIGFNAREWTMGSNTYMLHSLHSWEGLLLDITHENKSMNLHRHEVTTGNILDLFSTYNVPGDTHLLPIFPVINHISCKFLFQLIQTTYPSTLIRKIFGLQKKYYHLTNIGIAYYNLVWLYMTLLIY